MSKATLKIALCSALLATACSSTDKKETGQQWSRLIERTWELAPGASGAVGENENLCTKQLIEEDIYVSAIRPVHPEGTHHTLIALGDETSNCTDAVFSGLIYAAGVGSQGLELPEGVAMKLPKGKYLDLGLHLYNTSDTPLSGTSAIEVVKMKPEDVRYESEAVLAGPFNISIPPGGTTLSGDCTLAADQTMFALFPHMHQLGTHLKTTLTVSGETRVIHDAPYDFNEQVQIPLDPVIPMKAGDVINTECTYVNPTANTVGFGESSDTEMCFSLFFRYPAQGVGFCGGTGGGSGITIPGPACAQPGATGNELGIGKECTKGGAQCPAGSICLADFVGGEFPNFCTTSCASDTDCGTGATCQGSSQKVCIPTACSMTGDGGTSATDGG